MQNSHQGKSGLVEQFSRWLRGLFHAAPRAGADNATVFGNSARQRGVGLLEQETVMVSPFARKAQMSDRTLLLCTPDEALAAELMLRVEHHIILPQTKQEIIDAIYAHKLEIIFLDFRPIRDGTMSFRLAKKIRSTGYGGKIYLLGRSSENKGDVLAKTFGADGLVDTDCQLIAKLLRA